MATKEDYSLFLLLILIFAHFSAQKDQREVTPSELSHRRLLFMETELISVFRLLMRWEALDHDEKTVHNFNSTEVKTFIEETKPLNEKARDNMAFYTANPVGVYIITKRLVTEWRPYIKIFREEDMCGQPMNEKLKNFDNALPTEEELGQTAYNLVHLQRLYNLRTEDIATGVIGSNKTEPLTPDMCYDIAMAAEEKLQYYYAVEWYKQTITMCDSAREVGKLAPSGETNKNLDKTKTAAMQRLGAVYYKVKHIQKAVDITMKALEHDPNSKSMNNNLKFYERVLRDGGYTEEELKPTEPKTKLLRLYEGLCSGRMKQPIRRLSCHYKYIHKNNPFTRVRVEVLRKNPKILLFHNVMNATHMRSVVDGVKELLEASVMTGSGYSKDRRWAILTGGNHHVERITKRFKDLSGIDPALSRLTRYLAFNYGTWIHRSPFVDLDDIANNGRNSTTFMVFLNKVRAGGGVVFPWLKTHVEPDMGSVLFWYNTKPSGNIDKKLLWGECPILLGSKWVTYRVFVDHVNDPPEHDGRLKVDIFDKW